LWQILLQKSQNAVRLIFGQTTKQAANADRCSLKRATEVACEFVAECGGPHINSQSARLQPGKFVIGETKRLLQHYRHEPELRLRLPHLCYLEG
jgi:hypothetical protein